MASQSKLLSAEERYEKYRHVDPFPSIAPALLNSADITDYALATGMIDPFDPKKLKSASYEVPIAGEVLWWDKDGNERWIDLDGKQHDGFVLESNSIAFIEIAPRLRLPDYIAMRFNLKITHVYRGLLLGTGPLVDPGFEGKIYIPLHNLTSNPYKFKHMEDLIWIEFTKTTPITAPTSPRRPVDAEKRIGKYKEFPDDKKNKDLDYYIEKAEKHRGIISSIPRALREAERSAKRAERWSVGWTIGGLGVALALLIGLLPVYDSHVDELRELDEKIGLTGSKQVQDHSEFKGSDEQLNDSVADLEDELETLRTILDAQNIRIDELEQRLQPSNP
jgi:deoxycytidine triphosphate deaminase